MAAQKRKVSFTFVDPNRAADYERMFYRMLMEKLGNPGESKAGRSE